MVVSIMHMPICVVNVISCPRTSLITRCMLMTHCLIIIGVRPSLFRYIGKYKFKDRRNYFQCLPPANYHFSLV